MAITKQNTYEIGVNNDISNLSVNVDRNRLGEDKIILEVSGSDLLIKVGSLIEANGSLWAVDTSDISITLADGYLVFDDAVPEFKIIDAETAELDPTRAGFYRPAPNDTEKVTRWDISGTDLILNVNRQLYHEKTNSKANATFEFVELNALTSDSIQSDKVDSSYSGGTSETVLTHNSNGQPVGFTITRPISGLIEYSNSIPVGGPFVVTVQLLVDGTYRDVFGAQGTAGSSSVDRQTFMLNPGTYRINGAIGTGFLTVIKAVGIYGSINNSDYNT
jgi:hypothetical protein